MVLCADRQKSYKLGWSLRFVWKAACCGGKLFSVMDEGEIKVKGMFKCENCVKKYVSSRGLKRHQGMKHKNDRGLPGKVSILTASEFFSLVKRCSSICQQVLSLPQGIRSNFGSFDSRGSHRRCSVNCRRTSWENWISIEKLLRNIKWISKVYSTKSCYHKGLKEIILLPISCFLKLQILKLCKVRRWHKWYQKSLN